MKISMIEKSFNAKEKREKYLKITDYIFFLQEAGVILDRFKVLQQSESYKIIYPYLRYNESSDVVKAELAGIPRSTFYRKTEKVGREAQELGENLIRCLAALEKRIALLEKKDKKSRFCS